MTDSTSFSDPLGQNGENVQMLTRSSFSNSRGRSGRTRTRCVSTFNNGTAFFVVTSAVLSLIGSFGDVVSDWWVSIQSAVSGRRTLLFGDVYIDESEYGCVMLLTMFISGVRLSYDRLEHLQPVVRIVGAILLAPVIHFASLVDNISIIVKVIGIKKNRRQVEDDYGLKILKDDVTEEKQLRAKWEAIPILFLTTLKIGLTSKASVLESLSVISSSIAISGAVVSSFDALRKNAGLSELSLLTGSALQILVGIPIFATFVLCATFSLESERDAIFIASSDASPGLLILLIFLPLLLLFLTLVSVPHFTFIFFPFRLEPLKFFSERATIRSSIVRLLFLTLLFACDLCFAVYFVRRDHLPLRPDTLFNDCAHFDASDCGSAAADDDDVCHSGDAVCAFSAGKFELRVASGRALWVGFNLTLTVLLGVTYVAALALMTLFGADFHEMVRSLYCDTVMTEAHRALDGLNATAKLTGEWTLSLREKLLDVEAEIVRRGTGGVGGGVGGGADKTGNEEEALSSISSAYARSDSALDSLSWTSSAYPPTTAPLPEESNDRDPSLKQHLLRLSDIVGQTNSLLLTCDLRPDEDLSRLLKEAATLLAESESAATTTTTATTTATTTTSPVASFPSSPFPSSSYSSSSSRSHRERLILIGAASLLVVFLVLCVGLTAFFTKSCPDEMNHFLPIKGRCFHFSHEPTHSQRQAQEECRKMGGDLVEFDGGKEELTAVESYLARMRGNTAHFWTGLIKRPLSKFLHWDLDDVRFDFVWASTLKSPTFDVPWFAKEPGPAAGFDCVLANLIVTSPRRLFLYNWRCGLPRGFLCESSLRGDETSAEKQRRRAAAAAGCDSDFRDIFTEASCYHFEQSPGCGISWQGARDVCDHNNSTLATFETREEWDAVKDQLLALGGGTAWIGGGTITHRGNDFVWLDHTPIITNGSNKYGWWDSQPGHADSGDCIKTGIQRSTKEFGWQTFRCNVQYAFVCEMKRKSDLTADE